MIAKPMLQALVPLVDDLSRELPDSERYRRLLDAMQDLLPCDAVALLTLEGDWLVPLAVNGLSRDTLGRRFKIDEHPRFALLLAANGPLRIPADSPLPDPYDGLVEGVHGQLEVHDCMGCPVQVGEKTWGLLTLDALGKERLSKVDLRDVQAFSSLAAATVSVVQRIKGLALRAEDERQRADTYRALAAEKTAPPTLIGQSAAYQRLLEEIAIVGDSALTVLLTGETGVGKELVAQALHAASPRAARPLISLNCAALPETLLETSCLGMCVVRFRARWPTGAASLNWPMAAPCFWTKWASCRWPRRPNCCACCRAGNCSAWVQTVNTTLMCA